MRWVRIVALIALFPVVMPIAPVLANGGGHGGPTPTCRKGCKPLSAAQLRHVQQHPEDLPPQIGGPPPH